MSKRAKLVIMDRLEFEDGAVAEVKLWHMPASDDRPHGYKYSLVYIVKGERVIGYNNAEGKGDHRHYRDKEEPYRFKNVQRLMRDFLGDVKKVRG